MFDFAKAQKAVARTRTYRFKGYVSEIIGLIIQSHGPKPELANSFTSKG